MNISYISEVIKILPQKMPSDLEILDYLMQSFNNSPLLNEALEWIVVTAVLLFIFYWFGLGRSQLEDLKVVEEYEFSLGRQLARTSFRYLENVIKGKKGTKPHVSMLRDYLEKNALPGCQMDWVCPKVFVLFPFSPEGTFDGSYKDILNKKENETCVIQRKDIDYEYKVQNQMRTSVLSVIKCPYKDPVMSERNCSLYAVIAENRPLMTLQEMVKNPAISLSLENYTVHFELFVKEIRRKIEEEDCSDRVEILEFEETANISEIFEKKLLELRIQEDG